MVDHEFPRHWGPQGCFYHTTRNGSYGPSHVGESLENYKERVKRAYGTLRGITFHDSKTGDE